MWCGEVKVESRKRKWPRTSGGNGFPYLIVNQVVLRNKSFRYDMYLESAAATNICGNYAKIGSSCLIETYSTSSLISLIPTITPGRKISTVQIYFESEHRNYRILSSIHFVSHGDTTAPAICP
jgi:hypothetical protein